MVIKEYKDGIVILGQFPDDEVIEAITKYAGGKIKLVATDPPYGGIINDKWDKQIKHDSNFADFLIDCMHVYRQLCCWQAACYMWGGIGKPGMRPLYKFLARVEEETPWTIANHITWKKRRAYGIQWNYLFTREELIYLVLGDEKKPIQFKVPLLDEKRGYAGYNAKYPAKSEYLRRTNVWTDITELFRNKLSSAQKPVRLYEIPIETHTNKGDIVLDTFAGTGTCGGAARKLGRRFVLVERDKIEFQKILDRLS